MNRIFAGLCLLFLSLCGCDTARVDRLEKENAELKAKVDKADVARDFDLQAKCSKDARAWFNQNWSRDKDTILLDFTNHYNAKHNKCLILVEYHYNNQVSKTDLSSWTGDITLTDVYENAKYAEFSQDHTMHGAPTFKLEEPVTTCNAEGSKCKTGEEFNNLVRPYMND